MKTLKSFDTVYETLPGNGWLSRAEAELLWNAALKETGAILEVGSFKGRSTVLLAETGRDLHAVDPFDGFSEGEPGEKIRAELEEALSSRGLRNFVTIHPIKIEDWFPRTVGFAYLDGDHSRSGTRCQILKAIQAGAERMCIHDYAESGGGKQVKLGIEDFSGTLEIVRIVERMVEVVYVKRIPRITH